jgi:hypothetical protein
MDRAITAFLKVANPTPAEHATSSFPSDSLIFSSVRTIPPLSINLAVRKSYEASGSEGVFSMVFSFFPH